MFSEQVSVCVCYCVCCMRVSLDHFISTGMWEGRSNFVKFYLCRIKMTVDKLVIMRLGVISVCAV